MSIQTLYTDVDKAQWQQLVSESPTASWFQTPQAYDFYASLPQMMTPFVVAITRESAETPPLSEASPLTNSPLLKGLILGYITRERNPLKQFFSRRAIIIGGALLASDISNEELRRLLISTKKLLSSQCIYIEFRNFHDYSPWKTTFLDCGFDYLPHLNFHVDCSNSETIEANLSKSRKRDIRVSLRDGAIIVEKPTSQQVKDYYQILKNLYTTKVRTPLFDFEFFDKLYRLPSAHFLLVAYQDKIIGGTVCVELKNKVLYEWFVCGQDGMYKNIFPSELATYAGLQAAAKNGCPIFDMMGAGTPDEHYGVRDFKARFGGELVEYGRFKNICSKLLYKIGELAVGLIKTINI